MDTRRIACPLLALLLSLAPVFGALGQEEALLLDLPAGEIIAQAVEDPAVPAEDDGDPFSASPLSPDGLPPTPPVETAPEPTPEPVADPVSFRPIEGTACCAAAPGEALSLALPMLVECGGVCIASHQDVDCNVVDAARGASPAAYNQAPARYAAWATVRLDTKLSETPLIAGDAFVAEVPLVDADGNHGYAAFSGLSVAPDAQPGEYTLRLTVRWQSLWEDAPAETHFTVQLTVLGEGDLFDPTTGQTMSPDAILLDAEVSATIVWDPENILLPAVPMTDEDENPAHVDVYTGATPDVSDMETSIRPIGEAQAGRPIAVPVAVRVEFGGETWASNADDSGAMIPYGGAGFTASLPSTVSDLTVTLVTDSLASEDCPFMLVEGAQTQIALIENGVNHGYAVFDCFLVKPDAQAGDYPLSFRLSWSTWPEGTEDWAEEADAGPIARGLRRLFGVKTARAEGLENSLVVEEVVTLEDVFSSGWALSSAATDGTAFLVSIDQPTTAIVFSYVQLSAAVKGGVMTYVYIGHSTVENTAEGQPYEGMPVNNGLLAYDKVSSGLYFPSSGGSFVLDGRDPVYPDAPQATVQDAVALAQTNVFYFTSKDATFRNLTWDGANNYGIATAAGASSVLFENVTYTGIQMFYGPGVGTTATLSGCTVAIQANPRRGDSVVEEFMEVQGGVAFTGGDSSVTVYTPTSNEAIYNLGNTSFFFRVAEGTNVTVWSQTHFFYSSIGEMTIDGSLTMTLSGSGGGVFYTTNNATTLTVNGTLDITYAPSLNSYACILAKTITVNGTMRARLAPTSLSLAYAINTENGTLTVSPGATLEASRSGSCGQNAVIYAGTIVFDNPARVALYNRNGRITTSDPAITTACLTVWQNLDDPSGGGYGIGQLPLNSWNNQGMAPFTYSKGAVTGLDGGTGVAPGAVALTSGNLGFTTITTNNRYAVMGTPSLTVDPVFYGEGAVTGTASSSHVMASQYAVNDAFTPTGSPLRTTASGSGGAYVLTLPDGQTWAEQQSMVFVRAYDSGLSPWQRTDALLQGRLSLLAVSDVAFEDMDIVLTPQLLSRTGDMTATISDSRGYSSAEGVWVPEQWQLTVQQTTPFTSRETGAAIQSGMVFVRGGVASSIAGGARAVAATGDSRGDGQPISVTWDAGEGLFFELLPNDALPGNTYTATLSWTVAPAVAAE